MIITTIIIITIIQQLYNNWSCKSSDPAWWLKGLLVCEPQSRSVWAFLTGLLCTDWPDTGVGGRSTPIQHALLALYYCLLLLIPPSDSCHCCSVLTSIIAAWIPPVQEKLSIEMQRAAYWAELSWATMRILGHLLFLSCLVTSVLRTQNIMWDHTSGGHIHRLYNYFYFFSFYI